MLCNNHKISVVDNNKHLFLVHTSSDQLMFGWSMLDSAGLGSRLQLGFKSVPCISHPLANSKLPRACASHGDEFHGNGSIHRPLQVMYMD